MIEVCGYPALGVKNHITIQNDLKQMAGVFMGVNFDSNSHIGETHGIYTIVDVLDKKDKYRHRMYKCVCNECGIEKEVTYSEISAPSKIITRCKHVRIDGSFVTNYQWINKRICDIFNAMMKRCYNANNKDYQWYGAKGIGVCQEWRTNPQLFEEWAVNNGYTDNLTIDRINSHKDYCPENCRWIPLEENSRRAGKVTWIELDGKNMTGRQWADYLKIGTNTINTAIREHGIDKTKELILAMLKEPPLTKNRKPHQTWFSVYGIQI